MNLFKKIISDYGISVVLVLMFLIIGIINPVFLSKDNLVNILLQATVIAIISVGMTFVIVTGGIDLSVGSIVAFSGMILGYMLDSDFSTTFSILICLVAGLSCGLVSGLFVAMFKVPPFIATLGMMSAARGLALMVKDGRSISGFSSDFLSFSNGIIMGLHSPIFIMLFIYLIAHIIAKYTYWGRYIYAIGGNEKAAWLSGIPIKAYITGVYSVCGLLSAVGSIILTARLNSAQPVAGNFYELDTIAAVVIGGASLSGGRGTIVGTLLGALILTVLKNGFSILNIPSYIQQVAIGSVIVAAVIFDKIKE